MITYIPQPIRQKLIDGFCTLAYFAGLAVSLAGLGYFISLPVLSLFHL